VDHVYFDAASVIASACTLQRISPKVILTVLQRESTGVTNTTQPSNTKMAQLMGAGPASTARDQLQYATSLFRSYQEEQNTGGMTRSGWGVGITKTTQDGVPVTPATKAVAGQFTYNPLVGVQWGGNDPKWGGVYLFYNYWNVFGFGPAPKTTHTVTPTSIANGNISPSTPQTVPTLECVIFTASPATISAGTKSAVTMDATTGYVVDQWLVNGIPAQSGGTNFTLFNVTADTMVQVTFKPSPVLYTVTPSAAANGSISPRSEQSVASGDSISFTALPNPSYDVNQWLVNDVAVQSGDSNFTLLNVTADTTVQVTFNPVLDGTDTVTTSPVPAYGGTVSGGGVFLAGSQQTVTAAANLGYSFIDWTENGIEVSSLTNYTFTLTENRTLVANFTATPASGVDTNGPAIQIESTYLSGGFVTTNNYINLTGTVSDIGNGDNGISSVTVNGVEATNDTTSNGGTANWYATIKLKPGINIIIVVAKDTFNNSSQQQFTVLYTPLCPMMVDLNHGGIPNFSDFSIFASFWQNTFCSPPDWCNGSDFDKNGVVDIYDLQIFAEFWLRPTADLDMNKKVDFTDYALFADKWSETDCNESNYWCEGTDFDHSGSVDMFDLVKFAEYWLYGSNIHVEDLDMDGKVNFTDYAIFANHWMDDTCSAPNWCNGADFDHSGQVDMFDLAEFAKYWLSGS